MRCNDGGHPLAHRPFHAFPAAILSQDVLGRRSDHTSGVKIYGCWQRIGWKLDIVVGKASNNLAEPLRTGVSRTSALARLFGWRLCQ